MSKSDFHISIREDEEDWKKKIVTPRVACGMIVESPDRNKVVIIVRKFKPYGMAFPGGMVELGETVEECAIREVKEETNKDIEVLGLLNVLSDPKYDKRFHVVIMYMITRALNDKDPIEGDDAKKAFWMDYRDDSLMDKFTPQTKEIMSNYRQWREKETKLIKTR